MLEVTERIFYFESKIEYKVYTVVLSFNINEPYIEGKLKDENILNPFFVIYDNSRKVLEKNNKPLFIEVKGYINSFFYKCGCKGVVFK